MEYDFNSMIGFAWLIAIGLALLLVGASAYFVVAPSSDWRFRLTFLGFLALAVVVFGGIYLFEDAGGSSTPVAIGSTIRFGAVIYLGAAMGLFKILETTGALNRRTAKNVPSSVSAAPIGLGIDPLPQPEGGTPFETTTSTTPGIGDPVSDGGFGFVVTATESPGKEYGPPGAPGDLASGKWLIVHLTVENISDQGKWFIADEQLLLEDVLFELEADHSTLSGADHEEVAPGERMNTVLMFDVPLDFSDDCSGALVELHGTYYSTGVEVHLY